MDWLYAVVIDPYDHPQGWFVYLAAPILMSGVLARLKPGAGRASVVALSVIGSVALYFGIYVALYGVSSTVVIGVVFAFIVYALVCTLTVGIVRSGTSGDGHRPKLR